jgi:hypothetical protein
MKEDDDAIFFLRFHSAITSGTLHIDAVPKQV